ncbi:MAG: glycosyltransferase, partial [Chitinophagaceae bacterium]
MQDVAIVSGISIIIPNYNGRTLLQQTLPSVIGAAKDATLPFEIIICDDHSSDDSVIFLKEQYPQIKVLVNEVNKGFSPTINTGIFHAQYSHVLLLNSDVKLTPNYFNGLTRYFEKADTFGVMSKIVGWEDDKIQDGGKYPSFHGLKIKTSGNYIPLRKERDQWYYSMYLSGANAFVDRNKLLQLQGFDELFAPFYVEDFELSLRAWRMGWKCYYDDVAVCRHKLSVSIKSAHKKKNIRIVYNRNKMYLHAIHLNSFKRFQWFVQLGFESAAYLFMLRLTWLKSLQQFAGNYDRVIQSRKRLFKAANGKKLLSVKQVVN